MIITTDFQDGSIRVARSLEVDDLPVGRRTRLVVEVSHDGLGRAQRLPLIVIRGRREGPVFGLTCALHGNELNGIPVVHRLVETLDPQRLRGTVVVAPVLNIPGYLGGQRKYRDGTDLNHVMPGDPEGNESQVYAHRVVDRIVSRFNYLVDLHTASFGRVNSLYVRADMMHQETAQMAYLQRPRIILHNPPSDSTLRGAAAALGIPAITVEVGDPSIFQPRHIRPTLVGIRAVLSRLRMIPKRAVSESPPPLLCVSSKWLYTDQGGLLGVVPEVGSKLAKGDIIARQTDIFGDLVAEYKAPHEGVVIGKSVNPVSPTGARILHLGRLASDDDGLLTNKQATAGV